jgi:hypothetical protein
VKRNVAFLVLGILLVACSAARSPGGSSGPLSSPAPLSSLAPLGSPAMAGSPAASTGQSTPMTSAMPSASPRPTSAAPSPSPAPFASGVPVVLAAGVHAQVVTDGLRLRSQPWVGPDARVYGGLLQRGYRLWVLGGPVAGSGYWWYHVALADQWIDDPTVGDGWVASAAQDGTPWIAAQPFSATVPAGALVLTSPGDDRVATTSDPFPLPGGTYHLTFSGVQGCAYNVRFGTNMEFDLGFDGAVLSTVRWPGGPEPSMATAFKPGTSVTAFSMLPAGDYRLEVTGDGSPTHPCPWGAAITP